MIPIKTVADVVYKLATIVTELEKVQEAHTKKADTKSEKAQQLNYEATEHRDEAARAVKVISNVKTLLDM